MSAAHTPGPWFEDEAGICADGYGAVAVARLPEEYFGYGEDAPESVLAVHSANARLIAAAPELLEALVAVLSDWDAHGGAALTKAQAAIAKATGAA